MANKSINMVQIRRILQLHNSGTSRLQIATGLQMHRKTVTDYLNKFEASGKTCDELLALNDQALSDIVFSKPAPTKDFRFDILFKQFPYLVSELKKAGVTRSLLWEEYLAEQPDGYRYTQFCEHLSQYCKQNRATMHFSHVPGDCLQIDFAGKKLRYIDRETGEIIQCPVLVCTLPFSNFSYVEALPAAGGPHLFAAMNRCLEFLGGVPKNILSDNMKQYVIKNSRYEFTFQELAAQWAVHYNTNLDAARPRKPKDKPSVENSVYVSYLRIYSKLRNRELFSLKELNMNIMELLSNFNGKAFQKLPGSRLERFLNEEKQLLKQLPAESFNVKYRTSAKVQMNYHVILGEDRHQYSVPYQNIGKQTSIVYDQDTVEIYIGMQCIAQHRRGMKRNSYTTYAEHMPQNHLRYHETRGWDAEYFLAAATKIGSRATAVFRHVLDSRDFVEQSYKACLGLKRLAEIYTNERFEAACERALKGAWVNYTVIKNILEKNLDKQTDAQMSLFFIPKHDNIRGPEAYQ